MQVSSDINGEHPDSVSVEVILQTASIRTHNERRDNDLRNPHILNVENHPTIGFKSTRVQVARAEGHTMTGELTLETNTRQVTLAVVKHEEFSDPMLGRRIEYGAEAQTNRRDFGRYPDVLVDGRLVLGS